MVVSSYSDTLIGYPEFPDAAGVTVVQTVVSTSFEAYGDFVLFRWEIINRDDWAKGPWHAGTFVDWEVASTENIGRYSDACNGYFIWDEDSPGFAFGMLDPEQPARYASSDPTVFPAYRIWIYDIDACLAFETGCLGLPWASPQSWWTTVRALPLRNNDGSHEGDKGGLLVNPPISLAPLGSAAIHQALYYVDASSNNPAIIEANAVSLAHRAARWTGFARGDVNDDGFVDLADVCWLHAGLPIYPDEYSGDVNVDGNVDTADVVYLMNYVSGNGPGPMGKWRFEVPLTGP